MFGMGMGELVLIMIVALLVVGPDKLPSAAKAIGKGIRDFRRHTQDLQETLEKDENLGEAVRELKSALHGDMRAMRPPVRPTSTWTPAGPPAPAAEPASSATSAGPSGSPSASPAATGAVDEPRVLPAAGAVARGDSESAADTSSSPVSTASPATAGSDEPRHG